MYSLVLMAALTTGADAIPAHHGCGGCGYSVCCCGYSSYCGCGGYSSYCGCCGYSSYCGCGGYSSYCGCGGYSSYCGCGGYGYSNCGGYSLAYAGGYATTGYAQAPGETPDEFKFCSDKAKDMPAATYTDFRSSWLQKTHEERKNMMDGKKSGANSSPGLPAQILVSLPADAKLTFDGEATSSVGTSRKFYSPPLTKAGSYTLKAEFVREGKTVSVAKQVAVAPGMETQVSFDDAGLSVAGK